MRTHAKLLLGALAAAIVLASAVSTASANRLSISNTSFRQVWTPLTFSTSAEGGGLTIRCNVTLEGTFHSRTIPKVSRLLIGYVTTANVSHPCTGSAEAWANNGSETPPGLSALRNSLPWHITYEGFEGELPNITGVRLLLRPRFTLRNEITGLCEYEGNAQGVVKLTRTTFVATSIIPDRNVAIGRVSGGFFCPASGFFEAPAEASRITLLGNTQTIIITLI